MCAQNAPSDDGQDPALQSRFDNALGALLDGAAAPVIGLAVSGGGDSMGMLALAHVFAGKAGCALRVLTVDHGLRPEAADEALMVAEVCARLSHDHQVLRWHWKGQGNKMDAARRARLELFGKWCAGWGDVVLVAHTADDLAETYMMRLARGSGLEGLSAMAPVRKMPGYRLLRPCLGFSRSDLCTAARRFCLPIVDDPSNADPEYARARVRALLPLLAREGLLPATLAATAEHLREERAALDARAVQVWREVGREEPWGGLSFAPDWFDKTETATRRRLVNRALCYLSGAEYAPRASALEAFMAQISTGRGATLHGCAATYLNGRLTLFREYAALRDMSAQAGLWDGRWQACADLPEGVRIAALGEAGWRQITLRSGPPYRVALSLPALWQGGACLACDGLGHGPGATLRDMRHEQGGFAGFVLSR